MIFLGLCVSILVYMVIELLWVYVLQMKQFYLSEFSSQQTQYYLLYVVDILKYGFYYLTVFWLSIPISKKLAVWFSPRAIRTISLAGASFWIFYVFFGFSWRMSFLAFSASEFLKQLSTGI